MKFQSFHNLFFKSKNGAFSRVTNREYHDSQITLTGLEATLVIDFFELQNIQKGNVKSNPAKAAKIFRHYNSNKDIELNLVYPKPKKTELRLYLSSSKGFKPEGGMIWFIFVSLDDELVIGALDEKTWGSLDQYDIDDSDYHDEINLKKIQTIDIENVPIEGQIKIIQTKERSTFYRNPQLAILRFEKSNYSCEINANHKTFTSLRNRLPFVEAHHFIPMKYQHVINHPLDNLENLISLCPNCHRAFHYATVEEKIFYIETIYEKRKKLTSLYSLDDLKGFYNCIQV